MSKPSSKKERGCARVWWEATTTGRLELRLTTPVRSRAFLMRGALPRWEGTMYAPNPRLGLSMPANLARNYLHKANQYFAAGNTCSAGVYCREALRRFLECLCIYHQCLPTAKRVTPGEMVDALVKKRVIDSDDRRLLRDLLSTCNKAAHAQRVRHGMMACTISLAYDVLDAFRCLSPFERVCTCGCNEKPTKEFDDGYQDIDDDNDPADWWKEGGGA